MYHICKQKSLPNYYNNLLVNQLNYGQITIHYIRQKQLYD